MCSFLKIRLGNPQPRQNWIPRKYLGREDTLHTQGLHLRYLGQLGDNQIHDHILLEIFLCSHATIRASDCVSDIRHSASQTETVLVVTGSSVLTFIVLPHCGIRSQTLLPDTTSSHIILTPKRPVLALPRKSECQAGSNYYHC